MHRLGSLELVAATGVPALLLGMYLASKLARVRARLAGRRHNVRGRQGERAAERLLARHGYTVIERQLRAQYEVRVDDGSVPVTLLADLLVERGGVRFVAEVKTGRNAPRFEHAETRRQLLEYQLGFGVEAVVLVDVETQRLREVRFPLATGQVNAASRGQWLWLALAGLAGLCWLAIRARGQ